MYCFGVTRVTLSAVTLKTAKELCSAANYMRGSRSLCWVMPCSALPSRGKSKIAHSGTEQTVIRVPRWMQERIDSVEKVKSKQFRKVITARPGKMLVVSRRPQFSQPSSHTLGKFETPLLASRGYLLPVIQKLISAAREGEPGAQTRCVVLVPSRELAEQVKGVAQSLCRPLGLAVRAVGGGRGVGSIKRVFSCGPPDLLVATPGALYKALRRRCVDLSELSYLVMDEADTLFDESFAGMVESILLQTQVASSPLETTGLDRGTQLVMIGATFPGGVGELLGQVTDLGSVVTVKSRGLHCLMPHVKQTFMKMRGADKLLELLQAVRAVAAEQEGSGVLVFCNSAATVNWLGYELEEQGMKHLRLQGQMPAARRAGIFRMFQKGQVDVLVCTDIASRGLDTQRVKLVVNYDCPPTLTDYLHRAGRVGRAGSGAGGVVLSFVTHPWDVELVQKIETATRRRRSLPGMESAIHKPLPSAAADSELQ